MAIQNPFFRTILSGAISTVILCVFWLSSNQSGTAATTPAVSNLPSASPDQAAYHATRTPTAADAVSYAVPYSEESILRGSPMFEGEQCKRLQEQGLRLGPQCHANTLDFSRGRILVNCNRAIHLLVPHARIDIAPGAIVYVYTTAESTAILNLHDEHNQSAKVHVADQVIDVPACRELLVSPHPELTFDTATLCWGIGFRTLYEMHPEPGVKAYLTQFSTLTAIHALPIVRQLVHARSKAGDKIVKTAVAVFLSTHDRQSFRYETDSARTQSSATTTSNTEKLSAAQVASQ